MITTIIFLTLLLIGFPIFASILIAAIVFMIFHDMSLLFTGIPKQLYSAVDKNSLLAIPLFLLIGEVMNKGGLTPRIIAVADLLVGRFRGGLAYTNLLTNGLASSILGSSLAQIGIMSKVMTPAMVKKGYDRGFSNALTVAGGLLGPIFPPSMLLIIYGIVAVQPIGPLFIAGILPAILLGLGLGMVIFFYVITGNKKIPAVEINEEKRSTKELVKIIFDGLLPSSIPIVIIWGIASGVMTPTESGAVGSLIAFILGFIYREIRFKDLYEIFIDVANITALICGLIAAATFLSWVLTFEGVPDLLVSYITDVTDSPFIFLLLVIIIYLFLGMFLETISVLIVLVPILMPVVYELGIDPLQFGIICAVAATIGVLTPPVGPGLFIAMEQSGVKMAHLFKALAPFLISITIMLVIIAAVPSLSTYLPHNFM